MDKLKTLHNIFRTKNALAQLFKYEKIQNMKIENIKALNGRRILLGVCGSIAAYKAADLASIMTQAGANVRVIMTKAATNIISERVFSTLSRNPVALDMWDKIENWKPEHISLAEFGEIFLVAPASANTIANFANGLAPDTMSCTYLATKAKVIIAPAMNDAMLEHPATQSNIQTLIKRGVKFIEPATGNLACGKCAKGRLADIDDILIGLIKELI